MAVLHTMPSAGAPIITRMIEAVQSKQFCLCKYSFLSDDLV